MKIDEGCINHNIALVINDGMGSPWEYGERSDDADNMRLLTLGFVHGVLTLGEALKDVLKE